MPLEASNRAHVPDCQGLADAFLAAGCTADALIAAELVERFHRACACEDVRSSPETAEAMAASVKSLAIIRERFFEERGGLQAYFGDGQSKADAEVAHCCGARAHFEMGGSAPLLLGGTFEDAATQGALLEAQLVCPRYFAQCQQTTPFAAVQQDMLLHMLFGDRVDGVFVDVGSVDGFSFSNTYFFERNFNWTGICVEPNGASLDVLKRVRTRSAVYNACVSNVTTREDFVQCTGYTRMLSGLVSSMTPEHRARIQHEIGIHGGTSEIIQVQVLRLADILESRGMAHIDLLSVDTEGAELQVLQGIDWHRTHISVIILEMLNPAEEHSLEIEAFLQARGYSRAAYVCQDAVFTHSSFEAAPTRSPSCIHVNE